MRMPNSARPRLHPVNAGSNHRFSTVAMKASTTTATYTHHSQLHCDVVSASSHIVAITATPGSTSTASAPARAGQEAWRIES